VTERNAHPLTSSADEVHVVVNGIVENYVALKARLTDMGAVYTSETDAETIAHLIAHHLATGDFVEAVRRAYNDLQGHFAFVALHRDDPDTLVGARKECPLVVGVGEGERFLASDVSAFLSETAHVQWIENGELVVIRPARRRS
jgi:glucosamine--fructose-6-phosphate aminotransferase (isomerizing)